MFCTVQKPAQPVATTQEPVVTGLQPVFERLVRTGCQLATEPIWTGPKQSNPGCPILGGGCNQLQSWLPALRAKKPDWTGPLNTRTDCPLLFPFLLTVCHQLPSSAASPSHVPYRTLRPARVLPLPLPLAALNLPLPPLHYPHHVGSSDAALTPPPLPVWSGPFGCLFSLLSLVCTISSPHTLTGRLCQLPQIFWGSCNPRIPNFLPLH
jgi:hypothetical protein